MLLDIRKAQERGKPYVVVFCGVNGVGKSTNLAKIAYWLGQHGIKVCAIPQQCPYSQSLHGDVCEAWQHDIRAKLGRCVPCAQKLGTCVAPGHYAHPARFGNTGCAAHTACLAAVLGPRLPVAHHHVPALCGQMLSVACDTESAHLIEYSM